jgi:ketol-acid reductoisomerase
MKVYYDEDANPEILKGKTLGIVGYGNRGRPQALNLRDSGFNVLVATLSDDTQQQAASEGFAVLPVENVAQQVDLIAMLFPDEAQQEVYEKSISPHLRPGQTLLFSHGFAYHFRLVLPPPQVDVVLVSPRMTGARVRETYTRGGGAPAFVAVGLDASGHAFGTALAYAWGIGSTRTGVLKTDFGQETELSLFLEQALWPSLIRTMLTAYEFLVSKDFPPEMVVLEMYGSGKTADIFRDMAEMGFFREMRQRTQTSQYGTLLRTQQISFQNEIRAFMSDVLEEIRNRHFLEEWWHERQAGVPHFLELRALAEEHPLNKAESLVRQMLRVKAK